MKNISPYIQGFLLLLAFPAYSQVGVGDLSFTISSGTINYQGDLNPNSFTFKSSNFSTSFILKKKINRWVTWRGGLGFGKVQASDHNNRHYLKPRNLSFYSEIRELHTGFEITVFDLTRNRFTPYGYGGLAVFDFDPWTLDEKGMKVFLQPLGTEGQGMADFPKRKPYPLTQLAFAFGMGEKYAVSECINIGVELSERKTFTDYIDDVSTSYVDEQKLLAASGPQAVSLAYRGDELIGGGPYPPNGEKRGTETEMDWYYFFNATIEMKLSCFKKIANLWRDPVKANYQRRCPRFY